MRDPDFPDPSFPWFLVVGGGFASFLTLQFLQSIIGFSNLVIFMFVVLGGFVIFITIFLIHSSRAITASLQDVSKRLEDIQVDIHTLYQENGGKLSYEEFKDKKRKDEHEKLHKVYAKIPEKVRKWYTAT